MRPGDEVVVPAMTFAASAEVVFYCGARPVLADCRRGTLNLDAGEFERRVTERTRAVIPVHPHPFYRDKLGHRPEDFPNATWLAERNVSLPVYSKMSEEDVGRVIEAVRGIVAGARWIPGLRWWGAS